MMKASDKLLSLEEDFMIIETCPKCGNPLENIILTTYPSIPCKRCLKCGWSWKGKQEEIIYKPFEENSKL